VPRVGVISDTHGLLRPEALAALRGSDAIVHAGDVGGADVLAALAALAPVTAVRGNNDQGSWAAALPETATLAVGGVAIHVVHDVAALRRAPPPAGCRVVVSGHSHQPKIVERDGRLWVNPGSAGPRRFRLPVAVAELVVARGDVRARIVELAVAPPLAERRSRTTRAASRRRTR
jgi:putative phosphoesterase